MKMFLSRVNSRLRIKRSIRSRISGTADRPRLSVFRSNRNITVQAIDDKTGHTMTSSSTLEKEVNLKGSTIKTAHEIGKILGSKMKNLGITGAVFDRNGYKYHGVVKSLADGVRESGINF